MVRRKSKSKTGRAVVAAVIALLLIAAAVFAYLYRDKLFSSGGAEADTSSEPYTYEYGAQQQFALMGSGELAIASSTGLQILDKNGYSLMRQVYSMKNPALSAGDENCIFYDVGGTSLRLYTGGAISELDTSGSIISVSMNTNGYFALSCEESSYKGSVIIYDNKGNDLFKWSSGAGYVLDAAVSPDNNTFAVLCLESSGSVIHIFERKNEEEKASVSIPGELAFKLGFTGNGSFCTISESAVHFFKTNGAELESMGFGELTLTDYHLSDGFAVVALSKYAAGGVVTLTSFAADGKVLGSADLIAPPLTLRSSGSKLMVLGSAEVTVFSHELSLLSSTEIPTGYNSAVYLPDGGFLLLSSYHGEKISR